MEKITALIGIVVIGSLIVYGIYKTLESIKDKLDDNQTYNNNSINNFNIYTIMKDDLDKTLEANGIKYSKNEQLDDLFKTFGEIFTPKKDEDNKT